MLEPSTATVYRGARRRYFSKEAAARSLARKAINEHCECEAGEADVGISPTICRHHEDGERYTRLVDYIAKRYLRRASKASESRS